MKQGSSVLVTGGAGFLGSHLVDRLISENHRVTVVDNLSSGRTSNLNNGVDSFEETDIRSSGLREIFKKAAPEVIYHVAAQISVAVSAREPRLDADVNVIGGLNVLESACAGGAKKIVFVSTGGAMYGDPARLPADESLPPRPLSPYGASKLSLENYLPVFKHLHGLDYSIVRPANIFGPRQDPHGEAGVVAIFTKSMLQGLPCKIFGAGTDERDYIYVSDVVDLLVRAAASVRNGPFNAGTGTGTTVNALFAMLAGLTGYKLTAVRAPERPGDLRKITLDSGKSRKELGWNHTVGLRGGLEQTVAWFRAANSPK